MNNLYWGGFFKLRGGIIFIEGSFFRIQGGIILIEGGTFWNEGGIISFYKGLIFQWGGNYFNWVFCFWIEGGIIFIEGGILLDWAELKGELLLFRGDFVWRRNFPASRIFFSGKNPGLLALFWPVPGKMCCWRGTLFVGFLLFGFPMIQWKVWKSLARAREGLK